MPALFRFRTASSIACVRAIVAVCAVVLTTGSFAAIAAGSPQQAAGDTLQQRMRAAETRYREAVVLIGNADPQGVARANDALEDMEDIVIECVQQRGCPVSALVSTYERLLKAKADAAAGVPGQAVDYSDDALTGAVDMPRSVQDAAVSGVDDMHAFDSMVQYNAAVQEGIRRWLTDLRGELITSYINYQYLRPLMWPQYQRAQLPEALLFGILAQESNGRVHSTSRAGAAGPLQFMYATGQRFGLGEDATGFDTRYDPYAAAEASVAYLNERRRELGPSLALALAAYNGGEGRARRIHQAHPGKGFWDAAIYSQFPPETRDYVPMVIAAGWLFLHPDEYGIEFPKVDPRPAQLTLAQPASIYQLTICLGNRGVREGYMRVLRNLNPRYRADQRLPAGTTLDASVDIAKLYRRHCVDGARAELARRLVSGDLGSAVAHAGAATAPGARVAFNSTPTFVRDYQVQRGETLGTIARKFECDVDELARANGMKDSSQAVQPGQRLILQGCL